MEKPSKHQPSLASRRGCTIQIQLQSSGAKPLSSRVQRPPTPYPRLFMPGAGRLSNSTTTLRHWATGIPKRVSVTSRRFRRKHQASSLVKSLFKGQHGTTQDKEAQDKQSDTYTSPPDNMLVEGPWSHDGEHVMEYMMEIGDANSASDMKKGSSESQYCGLSNAFSSLLLDT